MRLVSVNTGLPREVEWKGSIVMTAIFKKPVAGPVSLHALNLEGDRQADLSVHGGPAKVVYAYPSEHYGYWRRHLPTIDLPWGMFGENFTTEGLDEEAVHVGDEFELGTARLVVTEPRFPCQKLATRFGRDDMVSRFLDSGRTGFYLGVRRAGVVRAGDLFRLVGAHPRRLRIADVVRLRTTHQDDVVLLRKAVDTEALGDDWRARFRRRLESLS